MRADYDSQANAIAIRMVPVEHADASDQVHPRAVVALSNGHPVDLEILDPGLGIDEPIRTAAQRYGLDAEALVTAARAALSAPDREVTLEVGDRSAAA